MALNTTLNLQPQDGNQQFSKAGKFKTPKTGIYLLTLDYKTETCGSLSLCGPTKVELYQNENVIRTFSRNLASDKKFDMDMVNYFEII